MANFVIGTAIQGVGPAELFYQWALDLLGRKVLLMTRSGAVREFTLKIANFMGKGRRCLR